MLLHCGCTIACQGIRCSILCTCELVAPTALVIYSVLLIQHMDTVTLMLNYFILKYGLRFTLLTVFFKHHNSLNVIVKSLQALILELTTPGSTCSHSSSSSVSITVVWIIVDHEALLAVAVCLRHTQSFCLSKYVIRERIY